MSSMFHLTYILKVFVSLNTRTTVPNIFTNINGSTNFRTLYNLLSNR